MNIVNIKYLFHKSNRKQLNIVSSMVIDIALGTAQLILSAVKLSLFLGFSGFYHVVLALGKFYALERLLKDSAVDEKTKNTTEMRSIDKINYCTLICSIMFFCFGIVIIFFYEDPASYGLGMLIFITITAIIKLFAFIVSVLVTLRKKSGVKYYVKLMSAASFMISLALTQRAILYYIEAPHPSVYSGIGGIFFSLLATLIGIFMVKKAKKQKEALQQQNLLEVNFKIGHSKIYNSFNATKRFCKKTIELIKSRFNG